MANKQIKDFDLKESIDGLEDLLIQDNGITKRIKTSKLMNNLDLSNYYTKAEVDKLLANTDLSIDMADYYDKATIENLLAKKANASHTHSYNNLTDKPSIPSIDGLATKEELTEGLATKSDATHNHDKVYAPITHEHKQYLTSHQNISGKADKTYVDAELAKKANVSHTHSYNDLTDKPTISNTANLATKTELTNGLATKANKSEIPSLEGYATETFVTNKIAEASLSGGEADLSGLATKAELATKADKTAIPTKTSQLTNDSGFLTEHQNISSKADKTYVDAELAKKANKSHAHSYNDLTDKPSIPSTTNLATKKELTDGLATKSDKVHTHDQYLTEHQDLSDYALKTELPTVPTKVSQLTNDSGFIKSIPSEYVTETELNAKKYLTAHQDISGKVDKVTGKGLSTNDLTTELKSNYDAAYTHSQSAHFSGSYTDLKNKPTIPTVDVNKSYVDTQLAKKSDATHNHDKVYALKTEIPKSLPANGGNANTVNNIHIVVLTQSDYDGLEVKDETTLYIIKG